MAKNLKITQEQLEAIVEATVACTAINVAIVALKEQPPVLGIDHSHVVQCVDDWMSDVRAKLSQICPGVAP